MKRLFLITLLITIAFCGKSFAQFPPDSVYLNTIKGSYNDWYNDLSLTIEDLEFKLDSAISRVESVYSKKSLSNAFLLHKMGVIKALGYKHDQAIDYYERALEIRQSIYIENHDNDLLLEIINGYNNIAFRYSYLRMPYKSIFYAESGLKLIDAVGDLSKVYRRLANFNLTLGRAFSDIGDFDNSLKYYESVIKLDSVDFRSKSNWVARAFLEASIVLNNQLSNPDSSVVNLNTVSSYLEEYPDLDLQAELMLNYSNVYYRLERFDTSLSFNLKSINEFVKSGLNSEVAESFLTAGLIYLKKESYDSAEYYLGLSMNSFLKQENALKLSEVYDNYGDLAFKQSRYKQALEYDNKSITYILTGFKPSSIFSNPDLDSTLIPNKLGLLKSLDSKGESLLALFEEEGEVAYLENALETYNLADRIIDRIRSDFVAEASKFTLAEQTRPVYSRAIEACWHLYQETEDPGYISEALGFSEKSRSVVLLDAIRKSRAKSLLPAELVQKENELNLRVNFLEKTLALKDEEPLDSLLYYRREHSKVKEEIRQSHPAYYSAIFEAGKLDLQKLRASLPGDTDYLEFFQSTNEWFVFRISRDQLSMNRIQTEMDIQDMVNQLNDKIQNQETDFIEEANNLYHALLPFPVLESQRLLIIPDGVLHLLNFDVLMKEDPGRSPVVDDYLISDHEISYAYSLTTLTELRSSEGEKKGFLGLSPPFNQSLEFRGKQYGALNQNLEEVREIESLIGGEVITNPLHFDSLRAIISNYQYVHFATHAEANDENGDLSLIFLSPASALYAKDIYTLPLNADMVVLSACRTNAGSIHAGEGIVSMARSFAYAGAPSVVTSLWNVREKPNQEIMIELYRGLKAGKAKDKALRDAKLNYLSNLGPENQHLNHPYFWAPLIVIGDRTAVLDRGMSPTPFILLIIILGFLIALKLKRS